MCGFTDVTITNQTQISVVLQLQSRQSDPQNEQYYPMEWSRSKDKFY
jgi:hypothetical protein